MSFYRFILSLAALLLVIFALQIIWSKRPKPADPFTPPFPLTAAQAALVEGNGVPAKIYDNRLLVPESPKAPLSHAESEIKAEEMRKRWKEGSAPWIETPVNEAGNLDTNLVTRLHNFPLSKVEIRGINMDEVLRLLRAMDSEGAFSKETQLRVDRTIRNLEAK